MSLTPDMLDKRLQSNAMRIMKLVVVTKTWLENKLFQPAEPCETHLLPSDDWPASLFSQPSRKMPMANAEGGCADLKVPNDASHRELSDTIVAPRCRGASVLAVGMLRNEDPRCCRAMTGRRCSG